MNILIYVDVFCGPTMTFLHRQVTTLSKSNNVTVVCRKEENKHLYPFPNIKVIPRTLIDRFRRFVKRKLGIGFNVLNQNFENEIRKIILDKKINVVLSHFGPNGIEINNVIVEHNIPHHTIIHGYDGSSLLREKGYLSDLKNTKGINYLFASKSMQNNFKNMAGINSGMVVPLGINVQHKPLAKDKSNYFFQAANFVEKKGHIYTLQAFDKFLKFHSEFQLIFAGDGPERKRLELYVKKRKLQKNVHFLGHCDQSTVQMHLSKCSAFLHHSITATNGDQESIPTGIMEAMTFGALVIATKHSGIPEVIEHGKTGFLVDEKDIDSYVECMKVAASSDTSQISKSAYNFISHNYNFANQLDKISNILMNSHEN